MHNRYNDILTKHPKPLLMGILNVTPDSFSDGGLYARVDLAKNHALQMIADGATMIDVGGESTRPGAIAVSVDEEVARVVPVIEAIRSVDQQVLISIDTSKPAVMQQAVAAGADFINDVNALQADGAVAMAAGLQVPVCLMHKLGSPGNMQDKPQYQDVVKEVITFLTRRIDVCERAGINQKLICVDPGFGFGKNLQHNLCLLKNLESLNKFNLPVLVGLSRKSMFDHMLGLKVGERLIPSIAAAVIAAVKGVTIIRVHDVKAHYQALKVYELMNRVSVQ